MSAILSISRDLSGETSGRLLNNSIGIIRQAIHTIIGSDAITISNSAFIQGIATIIRESTGGQVTILPDGYSEFGTIKVKLTIGKYYTYCNFGVNIDDRSINISRYDRYITEGVEAFTLVDYVKIKRIEGVLKVGFRMKANRDFEWKTYNDR